MTQLSYAHLLITFSNISELILCHNIYIMYSDYYVHQTIIQSYIVAYNQIGRIHAVKKDLQIYFVLQI